MTSQTFTVIGITISSDGNTKVRFANDIVRRIKLFAKSGHTRIDLIELPNAMSKIEALRHIMRRPEFSSDEDQSTINDCLETKLADEHKNMGKKKTTAMSLENIASRTKKNVTVETILDAITS
jgi:hypothetical protein